MRRFFATCLLSVYSQVEALLPEAKGLLIVFELVIRPTSVSAPKALRRSVLELSAITKYSANKVISP